MNIQPNGRPVSTQSSAYDAADNVTEHIDMDGITTYSAYNDNELTLQTVYNSGATLLSEESWGYDRAGNVTMNIDIQGYTTDSSYDDGQMTAQSVYLGTTLVDYQSIGYDQDDNVTYSADSTGNTTSSQFDGDGRMIGQQISYSGTQLESETWSYDGNGNVTDQIEILTLGMATQTRETRYAYDAMGDVTQEIDAYGTSLAATTITDYDPNGHLTEEIDPAGNTTLFAYDASGNETWTQNAMGNTSTMQYDGNNHLTSETDADGRLQTFTYNAQGLETSNVWFAGSTTSTTETESIAFGYDSSGNETLASNSDGTYSLSYNPLGQVTQVIEPMGVTLSMGYDGSGNRTLLEDSTGGTILSTYDTANELTTEIYTQTGVSGALRIDQQYDWLGRVVEQERYSDAAGTTLIATASYDYNSAGQITELNDDAAGTLIASYTDGYDGIGELTQQTINGTMTTLTYDQLGELTSGDSTSQTYTSGGNRTTDTTIAGNEVTYDGTFSYAYDPQGNETLMYDTTTATTWAYTYDNDNQMTKAVETVSSTTVMEADYQYNAFGNMTEEGVITYGSPNSTAITEYVIDSFNPAHAGATGLSGSNVLADLNAGGTLMTHYVWGDGIDQLFGRYDAGGTLTADPAGIYGTMTDQNGSVCDVIDNTGTLKVAVQYDAWGNILTVTGPGACMIDPQYYLGDFTYDTYDYDAATGYYDVNARVYSSASGRWLSQDPMGFDAGDSNLYRYVNNRPTEATDPSGTEEINVFYPFNKEMQVVFKLDAIIANGKLKITVKEGPDYGDVAENFPFFGVVEGSKNDYRDTDSVQVAVCWESDADGAARFVGHDTNAKSAVKARGDDGAAIWKRGDGMPQSVFWPTDVPKGGKYFEAVVVYTDVIFNTPADADADNGDLPLVIGSFSGRFSEKKGWIINSNPDDVTITQRASTPRLKDRPGLLQKVQETLLARTGYKLKARPEGLEGILGPNAKNSAEQIQEIIDKAASAGKINMPVDPKTEKSHDTGYDIDPGSWSPPPTIRA